MVDRLDANQYNTVDTGRWQNNQDGPVTQVAVTNKETGERILFENDLPAGDGLHCDMDRAHYGTMIQEANIPLSIKESEILDIPEGDREALDSFRYSEAGEKLAIELRKACGDSLAK